MKSKLQLVLCLIVFALPAMAQTVTMTTPAQTAVICSCCDHCTGTCCGDCASGDCGADCCGGQCC